METVIRYRGKAVTDEEVVFIRELIAQNSSDSRWMLSRKLCRAWGWVQQNGALRDMVCRGLMLQLARAGQIELPPIRIRIINPLVHRKKPVPSGDRPDAPGRETVGSWSHRVSSGPADGRRGPVQQFDRGASLSWLLPTGRGTAQVHRLCQGQTDCRSGLVVGAPPHRRSRPFYRLDETECERRTCP